MHFFYFESCDLLLGSYGLKILFHIYVPLGFSQNKCVGLAIIVGPPRLLNACVTCCDEFAGNQLCISKGLFIVFFHQLNLLEDC